MELNDKLKNVVKKMTSIVITIAIVEISLATLLIFVETILRYCFGISHEWAEESCRYLIISAALLASGPMVYEGGHVLLDLLVNRVKKPRFKVFYNFYVAIITGAVSLMLFIWGTDVVIRFSGLKSASLIFPMWIPYSIVPISMFLIMIYCLFKLASLILEVKCNKGS